MATVSLLIKLPDSPEVELVLISSADGKVLVVFNGKVSVVFVASSLGSVVGDDPPCGIRYACIVEEFVNLR